MQMTKVNIAVNGTLVQANGMISTADEKQDTSVNREVSQGYETDDANTGPFWLV